MTIKCDICGLTSNLVETFTEVRRPLRFKRKIYCPLCLSKRQESLIPIFLIWGTLLLIGVLAVVQDPQEGWLLLNLFFSSLCTLLMIIPHELGHAFVARMLGNLVVKIVIGRGRIIKAGSMFGFSYEVRQIPFHGLTLSFSNSLRWYRLKRFFITIAGLLVNLCFLLVALYLLQSQNLSQSLSQSLSPVGWLILANAWVLANNLIPARIKLPQGKIPNDGLSLLITPFYSKTNIEQSLPLYYIFECSEFIKKQQFQQAKSSCLQGLSKYPENVLLKNNFGVIQLEMGEVEEARTIFTQLLEKNDSNDKFVHAFLLNNLANANILFDRHELLKEADSLSAQAYQSFPWVPAFKGTRGTVLIELGELEAGIALLKKALEESEEPRSKAHNAAYLAIAEAKRGNAQCARQYMDTASQFDPTCSLIELAQKELLHTE